MLHSKGNSVVDYVILTDDLFNVVVYFKVNPLSYLSGHCPISFALKSGSFCRYTNEDSFLKEKPSSFVWDISSKHKFSKIAGSDEVVNSVTEILKDIASRCFERRKIKPKGQNKTFK